MNSAKNIAIRAQYPEDGSYSWEQTIDKYSLEGNVPIELAFYKSKYFQDISSEDIIKPLKEKNISVNSIHFPHFSLPSYNKYKQALTKCCELAKKIGVKYIVAHPPFGTLNKRRDFLEDIVEPILRNNNVSLLWETFRGNKRILNGIEEIVQYGNGKPNFGACYDFSHIFLDQKKVMEQLKKYISFIKEFHISDFNLETKEQHLPIFNKKGSLDFMEILEFLKDSKFQGHLTFEYLKQYHKYYNKDIQKVKDILKS
jgi:sugar phosphate isomerase/epimerase